MRNNHSVKRFITIILPFFILFGCSGNTSTQKITLEFQGNRRTCIIENPNNYPKLKGFSLLIILHGHYESANFIRYRIKNSFVFKKNGVLVAYPNGSGFIRMNWDDFETEIDFLNTLIDTISKKHKIDTTKIYIAGFSQGGMLAYRMACEYSERIAAIAMISSQIDSNYVINNCTMKRAVPLISINSKVDHACPYDSFTYKGKWFNSVQSGISAWAYKSGFNLEPDSIYSGSNYEVTIWEKDAQEFTTLWTLAKGGHAWPQGRGLLYIPHFEPSKIINANNIICTFFLKHSAID